MSTLSLSTALALSPVFVSGCSLGGEGRLRPCEPGLRADWPRAVSEAGRSGRLQWGGARAALALTRLGLGPAPSMPRLMSDLGHF